MAVLRRRADTLVQLAGYGGLGVAVAGLRADLPGLLAGAALVALGVRTGRMGVYVTDEGVTVRNLLRTWRVPRADLERVDIGRAGHPAVPVVLLRRREGRPVALWCLQPSLRDRRGADGHAAVLREVQAALGEARR